MSVISAPYVGVDRAGRWYYNYIANQWETQGGQGGAAAVELYGYQPSSLSTIPLSLDSAGNLLVNVAVGGGGGGSGSNAAAGLTGSAVPSSAGYTGWNSGGNLVGVALTNALPVQPGTGATFPVSGTFWQATQPVSAASLPLPSGAATSANQPAINGDGGALAHITNFPATQAVSGTIAVSNFPATQPVSGTVTANQGGAPWSENVTQFGGTNISTGTGTGGAGIPRVTVSSDSFPATQAVSGTVTANQGGAPWTVKPDGTGWTLTGTAANVNMVNASIAVTGTFWQATQPISAASLPLPAGAATSALQTTINTTLGTPMQQTGGSLSVTNFPATQAVSAAALPLPANAAQETGGNLATLVTLATSLQQMIDLQRQILATLQAIRLQEASAFGQSVEPDTLMPDPTFN